VTMEFSAQEKFYLEHEEQILEWRKLEKGVPALIYRFLESLEDRLKDKASSPECEGSPEVRLVSKTPWPKLFLESRNWHRPYEESVHPLCCIGFEWNLTEPVLEKRAYVGVWINKGKFPDEAEKLSTALRQSKKAQNMVIAKTTTSSWPIRKFEEPETPFWKEPEDYAEQILDSITTVWNELWEDVEAAVGSLGDSPTSKR